MATHAVIATGGKQYIVEPGKQYRLEKLLGDPGSTVTFDDVLLTFEADGSEVRLGTPSVPGLQVVGTVVAQGRTQKVRVFKYKAKSRYRRVHGHRQQVTTVRIDRIGAPANAS